MLTPTEVSLEIRFLSIHTEWGFPLSYSPRLYSSLWSSLCQKILGLYVCILKSSSVWWQSKHTNVRYRDICNTPILERIKFTVEFLNMGEGQLLQGRQGHRKKSDLLVRKISRHPGNCFHRGKSNILGNSIWIPHNHTCQHTKVKKLDIQRHLGLCMLSQI